MQQITILLNITIPGDPSFNMQYEVDTDRKLQHIIITPAMSEKANAERYTDAVLKSSERNLTSPNNT